MAYISFDTYIRLTESLDTEAVRFGIWKQCILNEDSSNVDKTGDPGDSGDWEALDAETGAVMSMSKEEALAKAEKIIQLCNIKIVNNFEWYKPFLDIMPPTPRHGAGCVDPTTGIGTMSTSGSAIYYDPKFVVLTYEKAKKTIDVTPVKGENGNIPKKPSAFKANSEGSAWYSDYACFIVLHEIMHNSLKHFLRTRSNIQSDYLSPNQIFYLWNIAQDYEINRILQYESKELGAKITMYPGGVDHLAGPFKVADEDVEFFENSTSDRIFWRLFKNAEDRAKKKKQEIQDMIDKEMQKPASTEDDQTENPNDEETDGSDGQSGHGLKVGDIIRDNKTGSYGRITSLHDEDEDVEWEPISKEEYDILTSK
jgi:hypothetical protein